MDHQSLIEGGLEFLRVSVDDDCYKFWEGKFHKVDALGIHTFIFSVFTDHLFCI